jgi:hypothetical protein
MESRGMGGCRDPGTLAAYIHNFFDDFDESFHFRI